MVRVLSAPISLVSQVSPVSPPVRASTRTGGYPQGRGATNYASSETTLAESPWSQHRPPPYGDEAVASPPRYADDTSSLETNKHGGPLSKRTLIIRLFTSIFIAFIVSLIVAAVVGRIHDTQLKKQQEQQQNAAHSSNGTKYTMKVDEMDVKATSTATPTTLVTSSTTTAYTSISRPTGKQPSTYSCPYITASATDDAGRAASTASTGTMCGLTVPFRMAQNETEVERITDISFHPLKDCVIARTSFKTSDQKTGYRCALSCSQDGGPGIDGLEDGWKWQCN